MKSVLTGIVLLFFSHNLQAEEDTVYSLNIKQAALTKQLNFIDQVSDIFGRYVVIRDSYFLGNNGITPQITATYADLDKWYATWPGFIERLSFNSQTLIEENLGGSTTKKSLDEDFAERVKELEPLIVRYRAILDRSRQGLALTKALPRLSTEEFATMTDPEAQKVNLIKLKNIDPHLLKMNRNLDELENLFKESTSNLQRDLLDRLNRFKSDVYRILLIKSTIYNLEFPELEAAIARFERILSTDEAMDAIIAKSVGSYQKTSTAIINADFLEAEAGILKLEQVVNKGFSIFLLNKNYDKDRVIQAQALIKMQLSDLKNRLNYTFEAKGGRRESLVEFILTYSRTAAAYCGVKNGKTQPTRYYFDCNLFKKNVAPFVETLKGSKSTTISEAQVEVIVKSLKNVFRGPLSEVAGQ